MNTSSPDSVNKELVKSINESCNLFYELGKIGSYPKKQYESEIDKEQIIKSEINYLSFRISTLLSNFRG